MDIDYKTTAADDSHSTSEVKVMQNRLWLLIPLLLLAGCYGLPPEPKGLPRSALLHEPLPGILAPDSLRLKRCDADTRRPPKAANCQRVYAALSGDGAVALQLAEEQGSKATLEEKLYWYNVAAENEDVVGMYRLGVTYYDEPIDDDPVGSKIRGRFWLGRAAQVGSKSAQQRLDAIGQQSESAMEAKPQIRASETADGELLKCGEPRLNSAWNWTLPPSSESVRIKCEEIPVFERQALLGSTAKASALWAFFTHIQDNYPRRDASYWASVAAQNGDIGFISQRGSALSHESGLIGAIRGRFLLQKAANAGDESAKRDLDELATQERLKRPR